MKRLLASSGMIVAVLALALSATSRAETVQSTTKQTSGRQYLLKFLIMDSKGDHSDVLARPYILVEENQTGSISVGGTRVALPGAASTEQLETGFNATVKVSPLEGDKIRLDLSLAMNELKPTDKDKIRVVGHSVREIEIAKIGERVHFTLDNDSRSVYLTVVSTSPAR